MGATICFYYFAYRLESRWTKNAIFGHVGVQKPIAVQSIKRLLQERHRAVYAHIDAGIK